MATSWCSALPGRAFWTGLCKACPLGGDHDHNGAQDPPRDLVPFVPSKHHMSVPLEEGAKPHCVIWEVRTRLVWKSAWIWTSLWDRGTHGQDSSRTFALLKWSIVQRATTERLHHSLYDYSFIYSSVSVPPIPNFPATPGSLGLPVDSLIRSFSLSCPLSPQVFK